MNISYFFKGTKPLSRLLGLFFIYLACALVAVPVSLLPGLSGVAGEAASIRMELAAQALAQMVVFMLSAWLFAKLFFDSPRQLLGLNLQGRCWRLGLVAAVVTVLLLPVTDWLSAWNERWTFGALEESMRKATAEVNASTARLLSLTTTGDVLLQVLVLAVVPAVCEELFFRGALQPSVQALVRNPHAGIVLTAAIFSLAHGDMYGFMPRLLLGLLLGYLFWLSGALAVGMCAHFVNNLLVVAAFHLHNSGAIGIDPFEPVGLPWALTAGCAIGAALLFGVYFVKNAKNGAQKNGLQASETEK